MRYFNTLQAGAALCVLLGSAGAAQARQGGVGWQAPFTVTVQTGQADFFAHYPCPAGFTVVNGAAFAVSNTTVGNGFILTGSGPRIDESPADYTEWAWNFEWPAGGAPAGSQIVFDLDCKKGAA